MGTETVRAAVSSARGQIAIYSCLGHSQGTHEVQKPQWSSALSFFHFKVRLFRSLIIVFADSNASLMHM